MPYVTLKKQAWFKQMSLDDVLAGIDDIRPYIVPHGGGASTRTYYTKWIKPELRAKLDIDSLIRMFKAFNVVHADLFREDMQSLYHSFHIPKKSGGFRRIDAPCDELMEALRELKKIMEVQCGALYHTSAYAYVPGRCSVDAIKRHQYNESKWFLKTDFSDFFGSTTPEFVEQQLKEIYPFCEIMKHNEGRQALLKSLSLCFLNGGLPQGTPISPMLTNLVMIPIDFELSNTLRDYKPMKKNFVYTRYADDIQITCKYNFKFMEIVEYINEVLRKHNAPFSIKAKKTRYGSTAGSNWNLGLMLNKDNEITVGHRVKRQFKAALCNYIMDKKNGKDWALEDVQILTGKMSYYKMVEPDYVKYVLEHYSEKFGMDVAEAIKEDLRK